MKKILFFVMPFLLAVVVFAGGVFLLNRNTGKGALQVTSIPKSKVLLNNKFIGETPLCRCEGQDMLQIGEYTLKLVPIASNATSEGDFSEYQEKITIGPSVLTVVDKTFGKGAFGEEKTITLTKLADPKAVELLVLSFPQDVQVFVDNTELGKTPLSHKTLTASDHEIKLTREGYREKTIRIRTVSGYKVTVVSTLGVLPNLEEPLASASAAPVASQTTIPTVVKVTILQTPTEDNHLNVRENPSLSGKIINQVFTGETFDFVSEQTGWIQIKLKDENLGWVSNEYAKKQ